MSFITGLADRLHTVADPGYEVQKKNAVTGGKIGQGIGIALAVTAVALLILGIALCATGNLGGIAAIVISLPLFWIGYSVAVIGSNTQKIAKNPKEYHDLGGFGDRNQDKMIAGLFQGTIGLKWMVECAVNNANKKNPNFRN